MSAPLKAGLGTCVLVFAAIAGAADSQDAGQATSQAKPQGDGAAQTTVTITAKTKPVRRTVDGVVYDEQNNPKGQAGTAGDVLDTVPSVHVTPDGQVTLRGDSNVQVYINGKPSAMMQGDSRALTLEGMPGSAIASVEVITNPSAKYDANGGGIINIVLKKRKKPGAFATLALNYGNEGRKNAALTADIVGQRLAFHTQLSLREDLRPKDEHTDTHWLGSTTGESTQSSFVNARRKSALAIAGLDDTLSDEDQLNLEATARENHSANRLDELHQDLTDAGDLIDDYDRRSTGPKHQAATALSATLSHKGKAGDEFRLQGQVSRSTGSLDKSYTDIYAYPDTPDTQVHVLNTSDQRLAELSGDGVVPAGDDRQLSYGFDLQHATDSFSNLDADVDAATGQESLDPGLSNRFSVDQVIGAAYVTWQARWKQLTALAGLRAEDTATDVRGAGLSGSRQDFVSLIPTLHLSYALDAARQIVASATQGYQRPDPRDLDPFTTYVDAQNVTSGNPDLRPQRVLSLETGYVRTQGDDSLSLTGYYKASHDTVTDYSTFLGDGILLTTKRNSGDGQSIGIEYADTGKIGAPWSYNLSGNLFHTRLQADDLNGPVVRAGVSWSAKAGLDYDVDDADSLSLDTDLNGKAVTAQGWRSGTMTADLMWRRNLTPKATFIIAINDIADGSKVITVRRTATVYQVDQTFIAGRQIFVGIRYRFGKG